MKSIHWRPLAAALVLAGLQAPSFGAETRSTALTPEQTALVERHRNEFARGLVDGNVESSMSDLAREARTMPEYHETLFGREAAERYFRAMLGRFDVSGYRRTSVGALNLGERCVEFGRFTLAMARKDNGQARELEGKYLDLWARTSGGAWELVATTWNYSRWPEFADELRFSDVPGVRTAFQARVPVKDALSFELAALNKLQETAIMEKNHALWSQFYADDAVLLPNHAAVLQGRAAIDAYLEEHVRGMPVYEKLDIRNDRIDDLEDWVIDYASHVANWRNGEASGVNTGKNIRVWRREPRGGLKMVCQIGTYD